MCGKAASTVVLTPSRRNRRRGSFITMSSSLCLDAGKSDHLAPLLGFFRDEFGEFTGRGRKRNGTDIGKPRLDSGIDERGIDLAVEPINDFRRRGLGGAETAPAARREAR